MMKNRKTVSNRGVDKLLDRLVATEQEVNKLPALSSPEKAKLDTAIAIDHLYYSSKLEGTHLTTKRIEKAMHGDSTAPSDK